MSDNWCLEKSYPAMGGQFIFKAFPQNYFSEEQTLKLFDQAHKEVARIEDKFTDFKSSPFQRINELSGISPCEVDDEIINLIELSQDISRESNGVFDISYASIGHAWRHARARGETLSESDRKELHTYIDYKKIEIDHKKRTVYLPHPKMKIGLGGIGKGYAVDRAFEFLEAQGLYNFCVSGSGDLRFHSRPDAPRKWRVGIQNPFSQNIDQYVGVIQIDNGAVATSGSYKQKITNESGEIEHHILNPHSGRSELDVVSCTIVGENCLSVDTKATIAMNLSAQLAINYLNQCETFGALIDSSGKSLLSFKALEHFGV